ncbi:MAG: 50S ribosome-binding GTPase [Desulfomonile tiedjei]|nr:50S ribosome-binding GTPase [Desulfomonile tiedjei]
MAYNLILDLPCSERLGDFEALKQKKLEAEKLLAAWAWKSGLSGSFPLITCLMGGTGTGKSTLFNSLAGRKISAVGMRRPCTVKAVILAPGGSGKEIQECPFLRLDPEGNADLVIEEEPETAKIILVDTPDFDSIELSNRVIAENFFIISDVLVFITSQEKYADLTGHQMAERAKQWGKNTVFVMNKVSSDAAFNDFRRALELRGHLSEPIRIERVPGSPELIEGLRTRPGISGLVSAEPERGGSERLRSKELERLNLHTAAALVDLEGALRGQTQRISAVNRKVEDIFEATSDEMEHQLDAIVSDDIEVRSRERLQELLRKYDILFVPRMMIRNALKSIFRSVAELITGQWGGTRAQEDEKQIRSEDFEGTRAAVRLKPLESAVARLNLRIAELLSSDPTLQDIREVAREDVARWGSPKIQELYDQAFPGVEHLLDAEFNRLREGLSSADEIKLYGSYTLWALLLITAEIVVGGGFTLLDALLNTVIVPFIPKWLLKLKVLDVLRDIGRRVDEEHRTALRGILKKQANLYTERFSVLLPDAEALERLRLRRIDVQSQRAR